MPKTLIKRYLITPEQFESIQRKSVNKSSNSSNPYFIPHPNARIAKKSEEKLQSFSDDPSLSETEKALRYAAELHRYIDNIKDAVSVPKASAITGQSFIQTQNVTPALPTFSSQKSQDSFSSHIPSSSPSPIRDTPSTSKIPTSSSLKVTPSIKESIPTPPVTPSSSSHSSSLLPRARPPSRALYSRFKLINDQSLNQTEKKTVEEIIKRLDSNPNVRWNEQTGLVTLNNKPIANASIKSLIVDYLSNSSNFSSATSLKKFKQALNHD